jgi:hypothetical protein
MIPLFFLQSFHLVIWGYQCCIYNNLHELTQAMDEPELPTGYNTSSVDYNSTPMASKTFYISLLEKTK